MTGSNLTPEAVAAALRRGPSRHPVNRALVEEAPLILLAGNRQSLRDRMTLEHAASEADIEEKQNVELLDGNRTLTAGNREILKRVEGLEQWILELETNILRRLDSQAPPRA